MDTPFGVWLPQLTVCRIQRLDQVEKVLNPLCDRHCVVMQLEADDPGEAQRIVDFVAGAVIALDATLERITESAYLCSPMGVTVNREGSGLA
jgi:cell division inhibitor SepF